VYLGQLCLSERCSLFIGYCFGEIVCIWDSCVYQKGVLCLSVTALARLCVFGTDMSIRKVFFVFLFINVISGSNKRYFFVRKYAVVPV